MESVIRYEKVTFEVLQTRLLRFVILKIQGGEYTERGLARVLGISQSQIHNVLKGARRLQSALADRMLQKFSISALHLFSEAELAEALKNKAGGWYPERFGAVEMELEDRAAAKKPPAWSESRRGKEIAG